MPASGWAATGSDRNWNERFRGLEGRQIPSEEPNGRHLLLLRPPRKRKASPGTQRNKRGEHPTPRPPRPLLHTTSSSTSGFFHSHPLPFPFLCSRTFHVTAPLPRCHHARRRQRHRTLDRGRCPVPPPRLRLRPPGPPPPPSSSSSCCRRLPPPLASPLRRLVWRWRWRWCRRQRRLRPGPRRAAAPPGRARRAHCVRRVHRARPRVSCRLCSSFLCVYLFPVLVGWLIEFGFQFIKVDCASRWEALQVGPAGGARRRAAHQGGGRWRGAWRPRDPTGTRVDQRRRGSGLLRAPVRPLPHLRRHLSPQLWP